MDRRDFLRLKTDGRRRVAELSCERLYMCSVDSRVPATDVHDDFDPAEGGEPPTQRTRSTVQELLHALEHDLAEADVVRVLDRSWLAAMDAEWRSGTEALLSAVRDRGGRVEFVETLAARGATRSTPS